MSLLSLPETTSPDQLTVEEIAARVGAVPLWRIRMTDPAPGLATEEDVERIRCQEDRLYELIDGVLVEKAVCDKSSMLAAELIRLLGNFVQAMKLGWILAERCDPDTPTAPAAFWNSPTALRGDLDIPPSIPVMFCWAASKKNTAWQAKSWPGSAW